MCHLHVCIYIFLSWVLFIIVKKEIVIKFKFGLLLIVTL